MDNTTAAIASGRRSGDRGRGNKLARRGDKVEWEDLYPWVEDILLSLDILSVVSAVIGVIGNIFTILVISKWNNLSSGACFMLNLACVDLVAVATDGLFGKFFRLTLDWSINNVNNFFCSGMTFVNWFTTIASYYATVLFRDLFFLI
ncbi:uncharacterized protein LOC142345131 [Convolutriloba macropyga]|uniref:uncharacterized protein LOC142345131 n=1 Tax=Convolutriloba macropyga TaxID=536237 RepID=UPI003F51E6E1